MTDFKKIPVWLGEIFKQRDVDLNELDYGLAKLLPPNMKGIKVACEIVHSALTKENKIVIIGDFDTDGATASVLLVKALKLYGAKNVDFLIPNRFENGYGLSVGIVDLAKQQKNPDIIITVDNGISSIEGVTRANELGIKVIITDHHLPPEILPNAAAIINPNQLGCDFESKNISGVGVAFYFMIALRKFLLDKHWFVLQSLIEPNLSQFLDLVALGTVADVVKLDYNNRILVQNGLKLMRLKKLRPGLKSLFEACKCNVEYANCEMLGFQIAPKLNAAGRIDDMTLGVSCLMENNYYDARKKALELIAKNNERKKIQQEMVDDANEILKPIDSCIEDDMPFGICLFSPDWHQGITGLLAGRIKDKYNLPTIIFADSGNGSLKGSARSLGVINIRDVLEEISNQFPNIIDTFGGHHFAAGLSINKNKLNEFKGVFNHKLKKFFPLKKEDIKAYDLKISQQELNLNNAKLLLSLTPWGVGFKQPVFFSKFKVSHKEIYSNAHLKLVFDTPNGKVAGMAFSIDPNIWQDDITEVNAWYRMTINYYNSRESLQLIMEHVEACDIEKQDSLFELDEFSNLLT